MNNIKDVVLRIEIKEGQEPFKGNKMWDYLEEMKQCIPTAEFRILYVDRHKEAIEEVIQERIEKMYLK